MNPFMHARTKHVELDYYFVRKCIAAKSLQISFLSNKYQIADALTKPLSINLLLQLRPSLTLHLVPLIVRGDVQATNFISTKNVEATDSSSTKKLSRIKSSCNKKCK